MDRDVPKAGNIFAQALAGIRIASSPTRFLKVAKVPKPYFDVVVIIPLQEEMDQFQSVFRVVKDHTEGSDLRLEVALDDSPLTILCTLQDDNGQKRSI